MRNAPAERKVAKEKKIRERRQVDLKEERERESERESTRDIVPSIVELNC